MFMEKINKRRRINKTRMEAAKLDEVYRCGFIGEEEYFRRHFALLNVRGGVHDGAVACAQDSARGAVRAHATPCTTHQQYHGAPHDPSMDVMTALTTPSPTLEQRGGDPWPTADEAEQERTSHKTTPATRPVRIVETPSWRLIDEDDGEEYTDEDDDEDEDTDDEAYERRHKPYERGEAASSLLHMTVTELRDMLRDHGLPSSGTKSVLAMRLASHVYVP
jgi:hypothetical protein